MSLSLHRSLTMRRLAGRIREYLRLALDRDRTVYPLALEIEPTVPQRILVFAPHADDETFGCGGTLHRHARAGHPVRVVCFSDNAASIAGEEVSAEEKSRIRSEEFSRAMEILGIRDWELLSLRNLRQTGRAADLLAPRFVEYQPDVLYVPSMFDNHFEHRQLRRITREVLQRTKPKQLTVRMYEVWTALYPNVLSDISTCVTIKREAMAAYVSQLAAVDYTHHLLGLNAYRAATTGKRGGYAEAFHEVAWREYCRLDGRREI